MTEWVTDVSIKNAKSAAKHHMNVKRNQSIARELGDNEVRTKVSFQFNFCFINTAINEWLQLSSRKIHSYTPPAGPGALPSAQSAAGHSNESALSFSYFLLRH